MRPAPAADPRRAKRASPTRPVPRRAIEAGSGTGERASEPARPLGTGGGVHTSAAEAAGPSREGERRAVEGGYAGVTGDHDPAASTATAATAFVGRRPAVAPGAAVGEQRAGDGHDASVDQDPTATAAAPPLLAADRPLPRPNPPALPLTSIVPVTEIAPTAPISRAPPPPPPLPPAPIRLLDPAPPPLPPRSRAVRSPRLDPPGAACRRVRPDSPRASGVTEAAAASPLAAEGRAALSATGPRAGERPRAPRTTPRAAAETGERVPVRDHAPLEIQGAGDVGVAPGEERHGHRRRPREARQGSHRLTGLQVDRVEVEDRDPVINRPVEGLTVGRGQLGVNPVRVGPLDDRELARCRRERRRAR